MSVDAKARQPGDMVQPILAGILASIVGYASTFTLLLSGYVHVGATPEQAGSGLFAISLAVGVLNMVAAWRLRIPVTFAWSTPGAAFLLTVNEPPGGYAAVAGAFIVAAGLIVLAGLWRSFGRAIAAIPAPIAHAMLAGVLLNLCLAPIRAVEAMPWLALPIIGAWVLGLRFARRYAVPIAVVVAIIVLAVTIKVPAGAFDGAWPKLVPILPVFDLDAIMRIALPMFIITMASQNLPGLAVMRANGYEVKAAPQFVFTGVVSGIIAFFGAHSVNLAAIVAAICAGPEAPPDPGKRWVAPVALGVTNMFLALGATLAAAFIAVSPPLLIEAVAGLALFTSLGSGAGGRLERRAQPAAADFDLCHRRLGGDVFQHWRGVLGAGGWAGSGGRAGGFQDAPKRLIWAW